MSDLFPGLHWKDWSFVPSSGPAQRRTQMGLNLLLFGYLGFTFAAALILYLFTAARQTARVAESVPAAFWVSTAAALIGGECLRRSVRAVRREQQRKTRRLVAVALACGAVFAIGQGAGIVQLLTRFEPSETPRVVLPDGSSYLDPNAENAGSLTGVTAILVGLHALHFAGGLATLIVAAVRTFAGRYDHEYHAGLLLTARYWTFLDVAWLVMLATFYFTL